MAVLVLSDTNGMEATRWLTVHKRLLIYSARCTSEGRMSCFAELDGVRVTRSHGVQTWANKRADVMAPPVSARPGFSSLVARLLPTPE